MADSVNLSGTVGLTGVAVVRAGLVEAVAPPCPCCSFPELCRLRQEIEEQHHGLGSLGQAAGIHLQQGAAHMKGPLARVSLVEYHMLAADMLAVVVAARNPQNLHLVARDKLLRLGSVHQVLH